MPRMKGKGHGWRLITMHNPETAKYVRQTDDAFGPRCTEEFMIERAEAMWNICKPLMVVLMQFKENAWREVKAWS